MSFYGITTDRIEEFAQQYADERDVQRSSSMALWEKTMRARQYVHMSPTPQRQMDFFAADPAAHNPFNDLPTPLAEEERNRLGTVYEDLTRTIEQAVVQSEGDYISLHELMRFDVNDLKLLQADELGIDLDWLTSRQYEAAAHQAFTAAMESEVEKRYEAARRGSDFGLRADYTSARLADFFNPFGDNPFGPSASELQELEAQPGGRLHGPDQEQIRQEVWLEFTGQQDKIYDEEIAAWAEKRRSQILDEAQVTNYLEELGLGDREDLPENLTVDQIDSLVFEEDARLGIVTEGHLRERWEQIRGNHYRWSDDMQAQLDSEEQLLRQLIVEGGDPAALMDSRSALAQVASGGMGAIGWGFEKLATAGGGVLWLLDKADPVGDGPFDYFVNRYQERQARMAMEYEDLYVAQTDQDVMERATRVGIEVAWAEEVEEQSDTYQTYLAMAGGDEVMAAGFFGADVKENPDVQSQLSELVEETRAQDQQFVEDLREQDFRFSTELLDVLGMYGRNVPNRIFSAVTLLATDGDYFDDLTSGKFVELWHELGEEASRHDFSAASAVGLDGSLAGLMMDFGGGIMFDPTVWFYGPKFTGSKAGTAAGTIDQAAALADSAVVRSMTDDIINFAQSPSRNASSLHHASSWLDDTARAEIFEITGLVDNVLPARPWAANPQGAMEVSVDFLRRLIPEGTAVSDDVLTKLRSSISEKGFDGAGELVLSRADNSLAIGDGVKRILAAEGMEGVTRVPFRIRVVDSAPSTSKVLNGMDEAEGAIVRQIADGGAPMRSADSATAGLVMEGADEVTLQNVQSMATAIHARNPGTSVGAVRTADGAEHALYRTVVDEGATVVYYTWDAENKATAAVFAKAGRVIGSEGGINMGTTLGRGTMEQIWDIAREHGDELILQAGRSGSISSQAQSFVTKYAKKLVDELAPDTMPVTGIPLDSILQGKQLKKTLKAVEDGAGDLVTRPDSLIPGELLLGSVNKTAINEAVKRSILRGAKPSDGARSVVNTTLSSRLAGALEEAVPYELRSFFTQANTSRRFDLHGPHAYSDILENVSKIWGPDQLGASRWTQEVLQFQVDAMRRVKEYNARMAVLLPQRQYIQRLMDMNGGGIWDDASRHLQQQIATADRASRPALSAQMKQAEINRSIVDRLLKKELSAFEKQYKKLLKDMGSLPDQTGLANIVKRMYDDYNRTHIVPRWQKEISELGDEIFDAEKGIVRWEFLQRSTFKRPKTDVDDSFLTETMKREAEAAGIKNPDATYRLLNSVPETPMAVEAPLSPIEMIAAATVSGKKWTEFTQAATGQAVRDLFLGLHKAWVIDKVLRPATAMTVSGDELLRIFHKGGRHAVGRYLGDRALFLSSRIQAALRAGRGHSALKAFSARDSVRKGARFSPRVQERLRKLDYWSNKTREWERIFYDDHGLGWTDIFPDDPIYRNAAQQWSANWMQQSGFRAYLRGEDAFKEWFHGVDGEAMRNATIVHNSNKTGIANWEDAYKGWTTMFEDVILSTAKKNGNYDEVRRMIVETASEIDTLGGRPINLPEFVIDNLGPIRGTQKHASKRMDPTQLFDPFFDRFFLDPVNYRQGFVADMVAQTERARIEGLISSQGLRVVSDLELAEVLGYKGAAGATRMGAKNWLTEEAIRRNIIPQSHIDDLVQRAVNKEIDHMLYVAERGSRAGRVAQHTVFPFGKPYADMAAFWGREIMRRPHFRGWVNEENYFNIPNLMSAGGQFNPRTPALISRLATLDFKVDQGFFGTEGGESAGLFPGSESTDLSPLLFLPTGGENPMLAMMPGLGYLPMWAIDQVLANVKDPIEDPQGYQELLDAVGDFIPGVHFGAADPFRSAIQRGLGGGTLSNVLEATMDLFSSTGVPINPGLSSIIGQIDREVDRARHASAILADPDEWVEILSLNDAEAIDLYLGALALEADQNAAKSNLSEQIGRFMLPANSKFSGDLDDIWDVWVRAGQSFPVLGVDPNFNSESATPDRRRQYADAVRSAFFDLPQVERDRLVTEDPTLAVNLVSSWTWTDSALDAGLPGTDRDYRTDGSREGLDRHQTYLDGGWIRPLSPIERMRRIIGLALNAKESSYKNLYEHTAGNINDFLWERAVPDTDKASLQAFFDMFEEEWSKYDIRSPQELWASWGTYEDELEDVIAERLGIEQVRGESTRKDDLTQYDLLRRAVTLDIKPWSSRWPGINPENLSKRIGEFPIFESLIDDTMLELADTLDISITPNMKGIQLYGAIQNGLTGMNQTLTTYVDPAYQQYIGGRTVVNRAVDTELYNIQHNQRYDEEWRQTVAQFLDFESSISSRFRQEPLGTPASEQLRVQDSFMQLMQTADDTVITDWGRLWELAYERNYGPLNWTPPDPRPPIDEDGQPNEGAYQPYIRYIIDGDSFVVRNQATGPWHEVRLLGVRARDYGLDDPGAEADKDRLWDAIQQAKENGDTIWLVRDSEQFGNVDIYGRELAWLWIGDEPFYFQEEMLPNRDPSGGDE